MSAAEPRRFGGHLGTCDALFGAPSCTCDKDAPASSDAAVDELRAILSVTREAVEARAEELHTSGCGIHGCDFGVTGTWRELARAQLEGEAREAAGILTPAQRIAKSKTDLAEAVAALDELAGTDPEADHGKADEILLHAVPEEIRAAYARLVERARWWAAS